MPKFLCVMHYALCPQLNTAQLGRPKSLCIMKFMHYEHMHYELFDCMRSVPRKANTYFIDIVHTTNQINMIFTTQICKSSFYPNAQSVIVNTTRDTGTLHRQVRDHYHLNTAQRLYQGSLRQWRHK